MIKIELDEKRLKEMVSLVFKENIKKILEDDNLLEYWVRNKVQTMLAKEVMEKTVKPMLTDEKISKLLKKAFDNYVYEKFQND